MRRLDGKAIAQGGLDFFELCGVRDVGFIANGVFYNVCIEDEISNKS